jgi:hypothetical protein
MTTATLSEAEALAARDEQATRVASLESERAAAESERGRDGALRRDQLDRDLAIERRILRELEEDLAAARDRGWRAALAALGEEWTAAEPAIASSAERVRAAHGEIIAALDELDAHIARLNGLRGRSAALQRRVPDAHAPRLRHPARALGLTEAEYSEAVRTLRAALKPLQESR